MRKKTREAIAPDLPRCFHCGDPIERCYLGPGLDQLLAIPFNLDGLQFAMTFPAHGPKKLALIDRRRGRDDVTYETRH